MILIVVDKSTKLGKPRGLEYDVLVRARTSSWNFWLTSQPSQPNCGSGGSGFTFNSEKSLAVKDCQSVIGKITGSEKLPVMWSEKSLQWKSTSHVIGKLTGSERLPVIKFRSTGKSRRKNVHHCEQRKSVSTEICAGKSPDQQKFGKLVRIK